MLEYAAAVGDQGLIEFVRGSYEWAKANSAPIIGFFPEAFVPNYPRCEADTIADMLATRHQAHAGRRGRLLGRCGPLDAQPLFRVANCRPLMDLPRRQQAAAHPGGVQRNR